MRKPRSLVHCLAASLLLAAGAAIAPSGAQASDASATGAYLQANYALVSAASSRIGQVEHTLRSLRVRLGSECSGAAANSPEDTDSEQLSNEVIGTMITTAERVDLAAGRSFVKAVRGLSWSSGSLSGQVRAYAAHVSRLIALPVPKICNDIRSWAASGFGTLPAATEPFDTTFLANWVAPGDQPAGLARLESGAERALARRTAHLEELITELEAREVATWGDIMNELDLLP